ncbi:MAG: C10 family peptidase [Bacteroidales bacterium]|nr:C10 family peptidase [Bacteroidales bacterium]
MKKSLLIISLLFLTFYVTASKVDEATSIAVVNSKIEYLKKSKEFSLLKINSVIENGNLLCYIAELSPCGFMIVSGDSNLPPVLAYSFSNNTDNDERFMEILRADISNRISGVRFLSKEKIEKIKQEWSRLIENKSKNGPKFQQWPADGTTTTGGWLESNWTQSAPYNKYCPLDPVTGTRSYVGCPATAMAMILNFHKTINGTFFTDADDYYHSYAGRNYWIDDDFDSIGFPSFPLLNEMLDTLSSHYENNVLLTNDDKAALSFACGVAASQVYTSSGSGTFGVNQAYDAYLKFDCTTIEILYSGDTSLYSKLAQNIKDTLPAHLALVDEAWSTGHNVVVDGYNTDNYFHVNFGWGGSNNGWYLLPEEMPYSLTVIEGLILDIMKPDETIKVAEIEENRIRIFPNPSLDFIKVEGLEENCELTITNVSGKIVSVFQVLESCSEISISELPSGIYFVRILGKENFCGKLVVLGK